MILGFLTKHRKEIGLFAAVFFAYVLTARIGLSIQPVNTFATLIWPPTGIALAVFILYGYRLWPAVALAAFTVNITIGASVLVALGIALGNTLMPFAGAYFLKHYIGFNPTILRLRDNVGLIAVAIFVTTISATVGTTSVWLGGTLPPGGFGDTWSAWWIGDVLGVLILTPLVLKWFPGTSFQKTPLQYVELCAVAIVVLLTSVFVFWTPQIQFVYYLFIPLTWAALRVGPRGTSLSIFIAASVAISATLLDRGPYAEQGLFYLQIFMGTTSALFLIFTAIVEDRKRAQVLLGQHVGDLERSLHKVSSADEAKKDFLAILAHELRNPLAAILSSVELLRLQEVPTPNTAKIIQIVDDHVRTMTRMLEDLLDLSRISHNKLTLRKETISLDSLIDRAVRTAQVFVRSRSHTLSVVKPEQELYLEADPIRLEQVVVNLLSNAAKYTNPNGSIELTVVRDNNSAVISIRDSGIGISKKTLKHIFEPFFQAERGKLATEGLGIGLPLTRQLVEMHGGSIEAVSGGQGRGSQFIVRLPLSLRTQPLSIAKQKSKSGGKPRRVKNTRTILVVDDNEVAAEALGRLLELRGHEVYIAYSGSEAVEKARESHPQIIILDIGLPDIDGYEVVRVLQKEKNYSPTIIALTGFGQPGDKERALKEGFHLYLTKPVGLKEIETAFRKISRIPLYQPI